MDHLFDGVDISQITTQATAIFSSLSGYVAFVVGLLLAFFIIKKLVYMMKGKDEENTTDDDIDDDIDEEDYDNFDE